MPQVKKQSNVPSYDVNLGINLDETIYDTDMEAMVLMDLMVADCRGEYETLRRAVGRLREYDFARYRYRLFFKSIKFIVFNSGERLTLANVLTIARLISPSDPNLDHTIKDMVHTACVQSYLDEIRRVGDIGIAVELAEDQLHRRIDDLQRVARRREVVRLAYDIISSAVDDKPFTESLAMLGDANRKVKPLIGVML